MIRLLRVDDSFLYGKISVLWTERLKASVIYIVSNKMKSDDFAKMTLTLAKPKGVSLCFLNMEEAVSKLHQVEREKENSIVVTENLEDMRNLVKELSGVTFLNFGSIRKKENFEGKKVCGYVCLSRGEEDICRDFTRCGIRIECQYIPEEKIIVYPSQVEE